MEIKKVKVTPKLATQWLRLNKINRAFKSNLASKYASMMIKGQWKENTGELIKFLGDFDTLIDGQHRLNAIVQSGITLNLHVATYCNEEAFPVLDSGRSRGAADVLSSKGYKSSVVLSASVKVFILRQFGTRSNTIDNAKTGEIKASKRIITNEDILLKTNYLMTKYDLYNLVSVTDYLVKKSVRVLKMSELLGQCFLCLELNLISEEQLIFMLQSIEKSNPVIYFLQVQKLNSVSLSATETTDVTAYLLKCLIRSQFPKTVRRSSFKECFYKFYNI